MEEVHIYLKEINESMSVATLAQLVSTSQENKIPFEWRNAYLKNEK